MLRVQRSIAFAALSSLLAALAPAAGRVAAQPLAQPPAPATAQPEDTPAEAETPAHTTGARADAPSAARSVPRRGAWYGWQTLAVDAGSLALAGAVAATVDVEPDPLNVLAATWYGASAVAAPAVHYAHDNWPLGLAAFGMRALAPPVIGFFGLVAACTANAEFEGDCARPGWAVGSLIGISGAALADALLLGYERPTDPPPPPTSWYGWQMLAIDLVGFGGGAVVAARNRRTDEGEEIHPALGLWAVGYTVGSIGGPTIHFAHGRVGIGFLSLGLRALAGPLLGVLPGLAGYCAATAGADDCAAHGAQWGLLGGAVAMSLFDALVLGYEPAEGDEDPRYGPTATLGPGTIAIQGYW